MNWLTKLFYLLTIVLVAVWLAGSFVPRGRITLASAQQIQPGVSIAEAEKIIGLACDRYDGIYSTVGLDTGNKADIKISWVNSRGAIVADVKGDSIEEGVFVPGARFKPAYRLPHLLYDRLIARFFYASRPLETCFLIAAAFLIPTSIAAIVGSSLMGIRSSSVIGLAFCACSLAYLIFSLVAGRWWHRSEWTEFCLLLLLLALSPVLALVTETAKKFFRLSIRSRLDEVAG